ncbi:MAG: glutamine--tRNA ligase, partial [Flavobacterium sp.]|nr:glutamine--tRNA ligase [Flavobacterium sp.]MBP6587496.1 glutamine--tRNA ligase [Flavobacterium sp.]
NNNKSSLLFAQLILKYSSLKSSDFEKEDVSKLYSMSLRSESSFVRSRAILNLLHIETDLEFVNSFKDEILKLKSNPSKSTTEREAEFIEQFLNK